MNVNEYGPAEDWFESLDALEDANPFRKVFEGASLVLTVLPVFFATLVEAGVRKVKNGRTGLFY